MPSCLAIVVLAVHVAASGEPSRIPEVLDEPQSEAVRPPSSETLHWSIVLGGGGALVGAVVGVLAMAPLGSVLGVGAFGAPLILAGIGAALAGLPSRSPIVGAVSAASAVGGMIGGALVGGFGGFGVGWALLANRPPPPPEAQEDFSGLLVIFLAGVGVVTGAVVGATVGGTFGAGIADVAE